MENLPKQAVMLLITSQDWGGAQLYVFELAKYLKAQGEDVIVAAGRNPSKSPLVRGDLLNSPSDPTTLKIRGTSKGGVGSWGLGGHSGSELSAKCREAGIPFLELKHTARDINPIKNLLAVLELRDIFWNLRPRVVHLNSTMMGVVGSLAARLSGVPKTIYCIGGWVFNEDLPAWKKNLYIWIEKVSAKWKDVIITVHPGDEELAKRLGIKPKGEIVTIANGIDVNEFESQLLTREQAREKLEIHPDATIIGTIANAYPPKNLLWYLDVCKKIHELDARINFVIVGDGPQFEALKQKRNEIGAKGYVMLAGRRMDAPALYKAFDLFVLPSSKEGMSITLLEAMTAKVPIVATDVGAARWMLEDAAMITASGDAEALSKAVLELTQNANHGRQLAGKAHEAVKERFQLEKLLQKNLRILE